jgi:hypothetical protein
MKGIKTLKLGLAGIAAGALLLAGGLLLIGQVSAASGTLSIGSGEAAPGDDVTVDLTADVGSPGLGAWTVDISYDSDVVSVADCEPEQGGVCNPDFGDGVVRITGASASGIDEAESLGAITFTCADDEGSTDLTLSVEVFADATIGAPEDIDETLENGTIDCAEAEPTSASTGTPLPTIVPTGFGPDSTSSSTDFSWLIATLSVVGVAALAGYGVLQVRSRHS